MDTGYFDYKRSSKLYDEADKIIFVPDAEDVKSNADPDKLLAKLDEISEPSQRLIWLFRATFDPRVQHTHESKWIRNFAFTGFGLGMLSCGFLNSQDIHATYQRRHNADVFDSRYRGNRHFYDTLIRGIAARGLKGAFRLSILSTSVAFVGIGSVVYRGKLHLPDWLVGFTSIGALSRLWIGSKGMIAGGLLGTIGCFMCYGLAKVGERLTGLSVIQMRYLHEHEYAVARQETFRRNQLEVQDFHKEQFSKFMGTPIE